MTNLIDFDKTRTSAKHTSQNHSLTHSIAHIRLAELEVNSLHTLVGMCSSYLPDALTAVLDELGLRAERLDALASVLTHKVGLSGSAQKLDCVLSQHLKDPLRATARIEALLSKRDGSHVHAWFPASDYKSRDIFTAHSEIVEAVCELDFDYQRLKLADDLQARARNLRELVARLRTENQTPSLD